MKLIKVKVRDQDINSYLAFQSRKEAEMQKLEKTIGDIYVGYRQGTLNPLVVEVGRERFTDLGDFEDFVKGKVKEAEVLKSALSHAKKINPQLLKIAQKYDKLYDKEFRE